MKYDASIHYRINDNTEASFLFRKGGGNSIYVGTEKYALRDLGAEFIHGGVNTGSEDEFDTRKWKIFFRWSFKW